jgi:hypothetical protein
MIVISQEMSKRAATKSILPMNKEMNAKQVSGVGDDAYFISAGSLLIKKGAATVTVSGCIPTSQRERRQFATSARSFSPECNWQREVPRRLGSRFGNEPHFCSAHPCLSGRTFSRSGRKPPNTAYLPASSQPLSRKTRLQPLIPLP